MNESLGQTRNVNQTENNKIAPTAEKIRKEIQKIKKERSESIPDDVRELLKKIKFLVTSKSEDEQEFFGWTNFGPRINNFTTVGLDEAIEKIIQEQKDFWYCKSHADSEQHLDIRVAIDGLRSGLINGVPRVSVEYKGNKYNFVQGDDEFDVDLAKIRLNKGK